MTLLRREIRLVDLFLLKNSKRSFLNHHTIYERNNNFQNGQKKKQLERKVILYPKWYFVPNPIYILPLFFFSAQY